MRFSIVWILFKKEILDTLRDKRTILIMILLPIVLYPLIGILMSQARFAQVKKLEKTRYKIGVFGGELPSLLAAKLRARDDLIQLASTANWRQQLREEKLALVLKVVEAKSKRNFKGGKPQQSRKAQKDAMLWNHWKFEVYYASTKEVSRAVKKRFMEGLLWFSKVVVKRRLAWLGLPEVIIHPFDVAGKDVISKKERMRYLFSLILPLMIVLMTVMGAFYPAIDLTAGEKERGTLETLLTAPISSMEIIAGKYLTVTSIALFTGLLNLVSMWFTFSHGIRLAGRIAQFQLGMTLWDYVAIVGFLFLVASFFAALMLTVATTARSFKEGQNYVTPVYLMAILPAIVTVLPGIKPTTMTSIIPVTNVSFAVKMAIDGSLSLSYVIATVLSMGVAIFLSLLLTSRIFSQEQVLFREDEFSFKNFFLYIFKSPSEKRKFPSLGEAIFLIAFIFILTFYIGIPLQKEDPARGLAITLWGLLLLPTILLGRAQGLDLKEVFKLKTFNPYLTSGVFLIVIGLIPLISLASQLIGQYFLPGWQEFLREANRAFNPQFFHLGQGTFFLLLALSPAICEEILFRGFVQSALIKKFSPSLAFLITAFLFGAFHLSIYRLFPTTVLGLMLSWLTYQTGSIFPAMIAHALNNGLSLLLSHWQNQGVLPKTFLERADMTILSLAILSLFLGIFLVWKLSQPLKEEASTN